MSNKLKETESEINRLQDQLDDEEDAKIALQKNLTAAQAQVGEKINSPYLFTCIYSAMLGVFVISSKVCLGLSSLLLNEFYVCS